MSAPKSGRLLLFLLLSFATRARGADFQHSYAVVVGIDDYSAVHKQHLSYARKDAEAVASYLQTQGYAVTELYDGQATKHNILRALHSVAVNLQADGRVVVFLSGHGANERIGDEIWGYFIPYDGADTVSYLAYTELQDASRQMSNARHQLFIVDACFSGLMLKTRSGGVSPDVPNYLDEVTKRIAREALTAGGDTQEVLDTGSNGHSLFTSALLEGLNGAADFNQDGYITFAELESYMIPRASNRFQTPASGVLPGNGGGEFVFRSPLGATRPVITAEPVPKIVVKRGDTDQLAEAKELLKASRFTEALPLFRLSASTDNPDALLYMGFIYGNGWGVSQNYTQAVSWYRRAAEAGNSDGMFNLGLAYHHGFGNLPKDEAQAVSWYRRAAEAGNSDGMLNLGWAYLDGLAGLPKDEAQAVNWYRKAAEAGNSDGMFNLGLAYHRGFGSLPKNEAQAVSWYRKAAEAGDSDGMNNLGTAYLDGRGGLPKDEAQAVSWFRKAAEAGNSNGMAYLGWVYGDGLGGLPKDEAQAINWYRKAAEAGNSNGMLNLGMAYLDGRGGLPKDEARAVSWFRKAAEAGSELAKGNLKRLGY